MVQKMLQKKFENKRTIRRICRRCYNLKKCVFAYLKYKKAKFGDKHQTRS